MIGMSDVQLVQLYKRELDLWSEILSVFEDEKTASF